MFITLPVTKDLSSKTTFGKALWSSVTLDNYLNNLLNCVVEDEEDEDTLAGEHKPVSSGYITKQFDRSEGPRWNGTTSWRKLNE